MKQTDYCYFSVEISVVVLWISDRLEGASVKLTVDNLVLTGTTDSEGVVVFTLR